MKRRFVLVTVMIILAASVAGAGEFGQWLKRSQGEHYQQPGLQYEDPKGDSFLIRRLDQIPKKLIQTLIKGSYPQAEIEKERELGFAERADEVSRMTTVPFETGKTHPLNVTRLIDKIHEIILEHPEIQPVMGEEHRWSPPAQRYLFFGFWHRLGRLILGKQKEFPSPLFLRSKLFLLLACGWTCRYAVTGNEKALEERILSYPDGAAQIHDVFRESYLLNRGNMYLTLLTCENVLASDPYRVDRGKDELHKKLAYIRNDSSPDGDNYGAWYHFFGIGLYGFVRAPIVARAVAEIESFGSVFLEGKDRQEAYINRLGAIFGRKLNRLVEKRIYLQPLPKGTRTDYMLNGSLSSPPPNQGSRGPDPEMPR